MGLRSTTSQHSPDLAYITSEDALMSKMTTRNRPANRLKPITACKNKKRIPLLFRTGKRTAAAPAVHDSFTNEFLEEEPIRKEVVVVDATYSVLSNIVGVFSCYLPIFLAFLFPIHNCAQPLWRN